MSNSSWGDRVVRPQKSKTNKSSFVLTASAEEIEHRIQEMDVETFVKRIQHFARTVQQLKEMANSRYRKESAQVIMTKRAEASTDATELKKAIQYHGWDIKNRNSNEDRETKIVKRTVKEFQTTIKELKDVLEQSRVSVKRNAGNTSNAERSQAQEATDVDIVPSTLATHQKNEEQKKKLLSAKLADWQQSTIDVETQIAKESYERTTDMAEDCAELNFIFKNFSAMIDDQDQYIDQISTNTTTARINVERGVEEINLADEARKRSPFAVMRLASFMPI